MKNTKTSILGFLLLLLLSSSLFAQDRLPIKNNIYYLKDYTCKSRLSKSVESIKCEICNEKEFSIQQDSIVFTYIERKCAGSGDSRMVYHPLKSTNLNPNTTLYLLEDSEKNLFKAVIKTTNKKVMVSEPSHTELQLYNHLIFQLDSVNNADKEAFVINSQNIRYRSYYGEFYLKLPKFTLAMYENIKDDLSNTLPENLDHSKHSRNDKIQFNKTLEKYFIENEMNPFHGKAYYRSIQVQEKLDKGFDLEEFLNTLSSIIIFMTLISVLWSLYRFFNYYKHLKSSIEPRVIAPTLWWIRIFTILAMVGFVFFGCYLGAWVGWELDALLKYNPGGNSIMGIMFAIIGILIGGILGLLLSVLISKKTRLV